MELSVIPVPQTIAREKLLRLSLKLSIALAPALQRPAAHRAGGQALCKRERDRSGLAAGSGTRQVSRTAHLRKRPRAAANSLP